MCACVCVSATLAHLHPVARLFWSPAAKPDALSFFSPFCVSRRCQLWSGFEENAFMPRAVFPPPSSANAATRIITLTETRGWRRGGGQMTLCVLSLPSLACPHIYDNKQDAGRNLCSGKVRGLGGGARKSPASHRWQLPMSELNFDPAALSARKRVPGRTSASADMKTHDAHEPSPSLTFICICICYAVHAPTDAHGPSLFYWHTPRNSFWQNHFILQFSHSSGPFEAVNGVFQVGGESGGGGSLQRFFFFLTEAMLNVKENIIHNNLTPGQRYLSPCSRIIQIPDGDLHIVLHVVWCSGHPVIVC